MNEMSSSYYFEEAMHFEGNMRDDSYEHSSVGCSSFASSSNMTHVQTVPQQDADQSSSGCMGPLSSLFSYTLAPPSAHDNMELGPMLSTASINYSNLAPSSEIKPSDLETDYRAIASENRCSDASNMSNICTQSLIHTDPEAGPSSYDLPAMPSASVATSSSSSVPFLYFETSSPTPKTAEAQPEALSMQQYMQGQATGMHEVNLLNPKPPDLLMNWRFASSEIGTPKPHVLPQAGPTFMVGVVDPMISGYEEGQLGL